MDIKKHIPNAITCLNLLFGGLAVVYTLYMKEPELAVYCIIASAIFDFFDGLVARWLGVTSAIGKDLDSLADVISFGLAPATLVLYDLMMIAGLSFWVASPPALLIAVFAGLRLAKFNNDSRQSTSFIGLPVPANAIFWIGYTMFLAPLMYLTLSDTFAIAITFGFIALFCYLMNSELPMFSFKIKSLSLSSPQLILVLVSVLGFVFLHWGGAFVSIVAYILLSLLYRNK